MASSTRLLSYRFCRLRNAICVNRFRPVQHVKMLAHTPPYSDSIRAAPSRCKTGLNERARNENECNSFGFSEEPNDDTTYQGYSTLEYSTFREIDYSDRNRLRNMFWNTKICCQSTGERSLRNWLCIASRHYRVNNVGDTQASS